MFGQFYLLQFWGWGGNRDVMWRGILGYFCCSGCSLEGLLISIEIYRVLNVKLEI